MTEKNAEEARLKPSVPSPAASPSHPVEIVGHRQRGGTPDKAGDAADPEKGVAAQGEPGHPAGPAGGAAAPHGQAGAVRPAPSPAPPARSSQPGSSNGAPLWYLPAHPGPAGPTSRAAPPARPTAQGAAPPAGAPAHRSGAGPQGAPPPPARDRSPDVARPSSPLGVPPGARPATRSGPAPAVPAGPGNGATPGTPAAMRNGTPLGARPATAGATPIGAAPPARNGTPAAAHPSARVDAPPPARSGAPPAAQPSGRPGTSPAATPSTGPGGPAPGRPAPPPGSWRPLPGPALATPARSGRISSFAPEPEEVSSRPAPAPPGTAHDFAPGRVRPARVAPATRGWRRAVRVLTVGGVSPGPGRDERRERELIAAAKAPIANCRRVAIVSRKGGIGKTTTTLMLGHTFATHRGDRVVALDANPDAGSLAYRVRRETDATVTQLLRAGDRIQRYSDMRSFTSQSPTRLEVLASDDDPTISVALGETEYREVLHVLEHHYNLILMDTGTGILDSATQGILRMADQIVLCAAPGIDASRASSLTLDWLDEHGYHHLVSDAVVVINQVRKDRGKELRSVVQHFAKRCRSVVKVPWDAHLAEGMEVDVDLLRAATRRSYLDAVAAVARSFVLPSPRR